MEESAFYGLLSFKPGSPLILQNGKAEKAADSGLEGGRQVLRGPTKIISPSLGGEGVSPGLRSKLTVVQAF